MLITSNSCFFGHTKRSCSSRLYHIANPVASQYNTLSLFLLRSQNINTCPLNTSSFISCSTIVANPSIVPDFPTGLGSDVYSRSSTVALNAAAMPLIARYLEVIQARVTAVIPKAQILLMQSSGGSITVGASKQTPVHLITSGPAAGVLAAQFIGEATGRRVVEQARESQRIIRDRYEAGLAPASDVLRAAELVAQAESSRTSAVIDVHVTAAAIDRAVGRSGLKQ